MRTYDEAFAAALDRPAFSNGAESEAWMDAWCQRCLHDKGTRDDSDPTGCPLVMVALLERTPSEWLEQPKPNLGDKFHCVDFRDENDPGPGYEPQPDPPLPGQLALFDAEPYAGTRMFVQPQPRVVSA